MKRLLPLIALAACDTSLDQRLAIIHEPRVIAVVSEPPEVVPGMPVTYSAVVASPDGPVAADPFWAFCIAPKPPTEDNAVSTACIEDTDLVVLGALPTVTTPLPAEGCRTFGPDTPPGDFRPRDADPTGGYYQPIRVAIPDEQLAFGLTRITCDLPNAPSDVARDYIQHYVANKNPSLEPLAIAGLAPDADVTLTASWPADAAETYLYYDRLAQTLITRREAMRVSWFATAGSLAVDASAVDETDPADPFATSVTTTWHTPSSGRAYVWLVLRDSRGGIATKLVVVDVP